MSKPTGLAAFTRPKVAPVAEQPTSAVAAPVTAAAKQGKGRKRAQGETVALTLRLGRADWARLHQLAVAEGTSLQALTVEGLNRIFAEHGLPPLAS